LRLVNFDKSRLPNLIVIGAAKAGTTSIHTYLDQHPQIAMAPVKETKFFTRPDYRDALGEYAGHFVPADVRGETDGNYTAHPLIPGVPQRMHDVVPHAKLVYLVRDPIARAESHYNWRSISRSDTRPVAEAFADLEDLRNGYVTYGRYFFQIEQYLKHFPAEQLLVVDSADLRARREETMREVFGFVGVEPEVPVDPSVGELNTTAEKRQLTSTSIALRKSPLAKRVRTVLPQRAQAPLARFARSALTRPAETTRLPDDIRQRLAEALRDDVARLRDFTGRDFATWPL
jgi:hypothetical protein